MAAKRRFTAEKKIEILREYLENDVSVSDLCEKHQLSPTMIYQWKKQLFEGALQTFGPLVGRILLPSARLRNSPRPLRIGIA